MVLCFNTNGESLRTQSSSSSVSNSLATPDEVSALSRRSKPSAPVDTLFTTLRAAMLSKTSETCSADGCDATSEAMESESDPVRP